MIKDQERRKAEAQERSEGDDVEAEAGVVAPLFGPEVMVALKGPRDTVADTLFIQVPGQMGGTEFALAPEDADWVREKYGKDPRDLSTEAATAAKAALEAHRAAARAEALERLRGVSDTALRIYTGELEIEDGSEPSEDVFAEMDWFSSRMECTRSHVSRSMIASCSPG